MEIETQHSDGPVGCTPSQFYRGRAEGEALVFPNQEGHVDQQIQRSLPFHITVASRNYHF